MRVVFEIGGGGDDGGPASEDAIVWGDHRAGESHFAEIFGGVCGEPDIERVALGGDFGGPMIADGVGGGHRGIDFDVWINEPGVDVSAVDIPDGGAVGVEIRSDRDDEAVVEEDVGVFNNLARSGVDGGVDDELSRGGGGLHAVGLGCERVWRVGIGECCECACEEDGGIFH